MLRLKRYIGHVALKLATLTIGAAYVSPLAAKARQIFDVPRARALFTGRAALVAHVFYPDLIDEIVHCHGLLPEGSGLIVTAPHEGAATVASLLAGVPQVRVVAVDNRGRDIAPFIHLLNEGLLDGFEAVLKLHTKKSPHLRDGNIRRRLLFAALGGSRRRVAEILKLFEDPATGAVGWRMAWRNSERFWMANRDRVDGLAMRMGLPKPETPAFFEGSMFWVRPAALERLKTLQLQPEDFEPEAAQLDGTLHHALERVFDLVVGGENQVTRDTHGKRLGAGR